MTVMETKISSPREAAAGVERLEVSAVNKKEGRNLYAGRQKIYAKRAKGTFRSLKWLVMAATMSVYYLLPWLRWDRGPTLPDQAVLVDVANGRIFFFWLEIWPQELYLITGFLVLSALALFLVTAIAGRVWCGYLCWQTVWTDLMIAVERFWQGDRNTRIRLDKGPWGPVKIFKKTMTHVSWLIIAAATGGAFVLYFRDAPTLAYEIVTGTAPAVSYLFLGLLTFMTYLMGGLAREQVCIYMCPWPRIQGAMIDRDSLLVTYRDFRGEPRGPHRKGESWDRRGDCIDCKACVAVCPMGIDIRDGAQLECIQCALCIDACDEIMEKINRPKNLIAYDTFRSIESEEKGGPLNLRLLRPRTMLYAGLIGVVGVIMTIAIASQTVLEMSVIADRNPLFVRLSDGGIRNAYTVKILNKLYDKRTFALSVDGVKGAKLAVLGHEGEANPKIDVVPDNLREVRVYVTVPRAALGALTGETTPLRFVARDTADARETVRVTTFRRPQP